MRDDTDERSGRDPLTTSFLDVLSCGLGGATLLFLIFSILPHIGVDGRTSADAETERGIDRIVTVAGAANPDDPVSVRCATLDIRVTFQGVDMAAIPPASIEWTGFPRASMLAPVRVHRRAESLIVVSPRPDQAGKLGSGSLRLANLPAPVSCRIEIRVEAAGGQVDTTIVADANLPAGTALTIFTWDMRRSDCADQVTLSSDPGLTMISSTCP